MKKTIHALALFMAVVLLTQVSSISALGGLTLAETYEANINNDMADMTTAEDSNDTSETDASVEMAEPESEIETDAVDEPEIEAPVLENIYWKNVEADTDFALLTDGMTIDCHYLQIRLDLSRAPASSSAVVDGGAVDTQIDGKTILLRAELMSGYHTFEVTAEDTVIASFGLTIESEDPSYPVLDVQGASTMILGEVNKIVITGENLTIDTTVHVNIQLPSGFKVVMVDISKGYEGMYSLYKGEFDLNITMADLNKATGNVLATIYLKVPATVDPGSTLVWSVDSAMVKPDDSTNDKTEDFQGTVVIPDTEVTVTALYTIEGVELYAVTGSTYTFLVKDENGAPAANLPVYVVKLSGNVLLGVTDENGVLTSDYFTKKGTYQVFAEGETGATSYALTVTCYESVGSRDGSPYGILFNGVYETGKSITWMSHILASGENSIVRVSTSADMANAVIYNGTSETYLYQTGLHINRVNRVSVQGLTPGTYYYQVGDGTVWSETKAFTVKPSAGTIHIAVFGDMANSASLRNSGLIADALANSGIDYDFAIQTGNAVSDGNNYNSWLNAISCLTTLGDMDVVHALGADEIASIEKFGIFDADRDYSCYTYGNVFVGVINYTEDENALTTMLNDVAQIGRRANVKWRILVMNQAPYTTDSEKADSAASKVVPTIAERGGFDLVLSGGECNFARTGALREGVVTHRNGVVYMVCGSLGEKASAINYGDFAVTMEDFNSIYVSLTIDENSFIATAYNVLEDGTVEVVDSVSLHQYVCAEDEHMYRMDHGYKVYICDYCDQEIHLKDHIGLVAISYTYMFSNGSGFSAGWYLYRGKVYYFDLVDYKAVNGVQIIDGKTYVFENYTLAYVYDGNNQPVPFS